MSGLDELLQRPEWQARAACRGMGTDLFFPSRGTHLTGVREAQRICDGCPVKEQCRDFGLGEHHGIWGGLPEQQRRKVRRMRNAAPGPRPGYTWPKDYRCECEACGVFFDSAKPATRFCSGACRTFADKVRRGLKPADAERHGPTQRTKAVWHS